MHLDRLITTLETVASAGRPVSATQVQQASGLPRPTCYRLLASLAEHRLLDEPEPGRYRVGQRIMRLALLGQTDEQASRAAAPILSEAADHFGEAVFLSRYRNQGVEIIHVETPREPGRSFMHPGLGVRPMHACSCAKVIAAFADDTARAEMLSTLRAAPPTDPPSTNPLRRYTPHTKQTYQALAAEFDGIRSNGFAECVQEIELGVCSVAAPVRIGALGPTFSLGATGPLRRFTQKRRAQIGSELCSLADKLSVSLMPDAGAS